MFTDMIEVKSANRVRGHHFFEPGAMRFFRSRIGSALYGGRYFITSEQFEGSNGYRAERAFTVREALTDGTIETVGAFQAYATRAQALGAIRKLLASA